MCLYALRGKRITQKNTSSYNLNFDIFSFVAFLLRGRKGYFQRDTHLTAWFKLNTEKEKAHVDIPYHSLDI